MKRVLALISALLILLAVVMVAWIFSAPIAQWSRSAQSLDAVAFLQEHLLAVGMIGGGLLILALIWLPKWQASGVQDIKDRLAVENAARQTLAQIVGGAVLLAGLFFTWANLHIAQENIKITQETATKSQETATRNLELAQEGQITDRFTKAIDQLGALNNKGKKNLEVRLGGIYALERIAKKSPDDHWPIMEVLTAYVREDERQRKTGATSKGDQLDTDIQAILTVLGRRNRDDEKGDQRLELRGTDLRRAQLREAHLEMAFLTEAHLKGALLQKARLEWAHLTEAHLEGADLQQAHLKGAYLMGADLTKAYLEGADLTEAHLEGAILKRASLFGTDLTAADNLTVEQLCTVETLYEAQIDPPLREQIRQQCPQRLEKP